MKLIYGNIIATDPNLSCNNMVVEMSGDVYSNAFHGGSDGTLCVEWNDKYENITPIGIRRWVFENFSIRLHTHVYIAPCHPAAVIKRYAKELDALNIHIIGDWEEVTWTGPIRVGQIVVGYFAISDAEHDAHVRPDAATMQQIAVWYYLMHPQLEAEPEAEYIEPKRCYPEPVCYAQQGISKTTIFDVMFYNNKDCILPFPHCWGHRLRVQIVSLFSIENRFLFIYASQEISNGNQTQ